MHRKILLMIAACFAVNIACAAERIEIFSLKSRLAQEIIPIIKPLAGPGSTITGMGDKLVVKANEQQLRQIQQLLSELDRPPKRLLIEVRQTTQAERKSDGGRFDARIESDDANVTIGRRAREGVGVRIRSTNTRRDDDILQQIQALEGRAAYIATGQSVPIHEPSVQVYGNRVYAQNQTYYRDATTGFFVIPRVSGQSVTLTLRQHADQVNPGDQRFTLQRAETSLSGRLGEWLDVGGSRQTGATDATGINRVTRTRHRDDRFIQLRVTELN